MSRKLATLSVLILIALAQRPYAQAGTARIFFVDIGQGAGTLIVSPAGKTLLVDGGPPEAARRSAHCSIRWASRPSTTVLTHYHIDHDSGLIEPLNAGRVAGLRMTTATGRTCSRPERPTSPTSTRGNLSELRHGVRARRRDATDDCA
jgi:glyoxylase-like metal-dependent hydrolase (beta-lactamase superfamily II)